MNKADAIRAMELAGLAYQNKQPEFPSCTLDILDDACTGIQCYLRRAGETLYITFRGSNSAKDWRVDLTFWKKCIPYDHVNPKIRVHSGFCRRV